ncbi:MOSC domain-containing protein [Marinomonas sp. 2405UD68-3]|uniref:MOSC domain-containing protein n=1 Tax=Marinomonas sp. 2405UD68-3 TaxID=3391835 RepID=UPI0039C97D29
MRPIVNELSIYPIKSIQGIKLTESIAEFSGLTNDRKYLVVDKNGECVTGRKHPLITLINATIRSDNTLELAHPDQPDSLIINHTEFTNKRMTVDVWETKIDALICGSKYDTWMSNILSEPVTLVYFDEQSIRVTNRRPDMPVSFADSYPFLITSLASLQALNDRCPETMVMERFRSNIIVDHCDAFAEDTWQKIKIGDAIFEAVTPCVRCIFTTLEPNTAQRGKKGEPIKTLAKFRMLEKKGVTFGMNFVCTQQGLIKQGDPIEILSYREPEQYTDAKTTKKPSSNES